MSVSAQAGGPLPGGSFPGGEHARRSPTDDAFAAIVENMAQQTHGMVSVEAVFAHRPAGAAPPGPVERARESQGRAAVASPMEPAHAKPFVEAAADELRSPSGRAHTAAHRQATPDRGDGSPASEQGNARDRPGTMQDARASRNDSEPARHDPRTPPADARPLGGAPASGQSGTGLAGQAQFAEPAPGQNAARSEAQAAAPARSVQPTKGGEPGALRTLVAAGSGIDRSAGRPAQARGGQGAGRHGAQETSAEAFRAQLARGLAVALKRGDGQVTLRLHPESLGLVRVTLGVRNGVVTASLEPTTAQARELLEGNLSALRGALEARGLHVERLVVQPGGPQATEAKADAPRDGSDQPKAGGDGASEAGSEDRSRDGPGDSGRADAGAGSAAHGRVDAREGVGESFWNDGAPGIVVSADGAAVVVRLDVIA